VGGRQNRFGQNPISEGCAYAPAGVSRLSCELLDRATRMVQGRGAEIAESRTNMDLCCAD